jgi:hypothetical protein
VGFSSPSRKILGFCVTTGHDRFFLQPSKCIVHNLVADKASLKEQRESTLQFPVDIYFPNAFLATLHKSLMLMFIWDVSDSVDKVGF